MAKDILRCSATCAIECITHQELSGHVVGRSMHSITHVAGQRRLTLCNIFQSQTTPCKDVFPPEPRSGVSLTKMFPSKVRTTARPYAGQCLGCALGTHAVPRRVHASCKVTTGDSPVCCGQISRFVETDSHNPQSRVSYHWTPSAFGQVMSRSMHSITHVAGQRRLGLCTTQSVDFKKGCPCGASARLLRANASGEVKSVLLPCYFLSLRVRTLLTHGEGVGYTRPTNGSLTRTVMHNYSVTMLQGSKDVRRQKLGLEEQWRIPQSDRLGFGKCLLLLCIHKLNHLAEAEGYHRSTRSVVRPRSTSTQ